VWLLHTRHDHDRGDLVHRKGHDLSDEVIREELEGNLCRCTGYQNIVLSIAAGAKAMAKSDLA
jgi:carbon-monoxide dehydrogenase small subunit